MKPISVLLLSSTLLVMSYSTAWSQDCPIVLSQPAPAWQVECKAIINGPRCGAGVSSAQCTTYNNDAYALGYLTQEAYDWLQSNGQCAFAIQGIGIITICPVGCFEENTSLLTLDDDGSQTWTAAKDVTMEHQLLSLGADAPLSEPGLESHAIARRVYGDEALDLYVFTLSNGHKLRVTQQHAMVLADGKVIEAQAVVAGDLFLGMDGSAVMVEEITREATDADVYNFSVAADTLQEHVIVAEGVLVGDLTWQNTLANEKDSIELRR
ncbi:hypothetical protein [Haliangium ochraceum]|uniref:Hedgehog/intein hint domain protein n=1 Tax=Haliangium ochraceum (strain DSM 14365 / JCM 11303 / SMP-2) TaxID=502025 RepID=D0LMP6_HALO1|nr:hypothetical protein [Haliangium ochraceum]ACY18733.1 hypothetical protein Hoch_6262 [Haliangium ochraceum DSM 14365]